jgi:hypothetical protein
VARLAPEVTCLRPESTFPEGPNGTPYSLLESETQHRGSIAVESVLGHGSTFVVRLPIADAIADPTRWNDWLSFGGSGVEEASEPSNPRRSRLV